MPDIVKTMKLHIHIGQDDLPAVQETVEAYRRACNYVSQYVFDNGMLLTFLKLVDKTYTTLRGEYGLKSQFAQSAAKTVIARYKTIRTQMLREPYKYLDESGKRHYIPKDPDWLQKPVFFSRPQADFVRGRDYSFVSGRDDRTYLSINTLKGRVLVLYDVPDHFKEYFDRDCENPWSFGTAKLVELKGEWYFHIPCTKAAETVMDPSRPAHVVGIDRGLRFLAVTHDEAGKSAFYCGKEASKKRASFDHTRAELQAKGTKSAKRALKRISGRENRWMADVNHRLSKTLVRKYGAGTLFVLEDLTGVSFNERNFDGRTKTERHELRSWPFYQFGQFLAYKAAATGSSVIEVDPRYTSQRCPKCGRIHKENRDHKTHLYTCDSCGYKSNDDRIGAMNLYLLGTQFASGDMHPRIRVSQN